MTNTNTKTVAIYSTSAECYRDVNEVYTAILEQTGSRIAPDVSHGVDSNCEVSFIVHERFDKLNPQSIKAAIDSVSDANDMNDFMIVETFEFPEDWHLAEGDYYDLAPHTVANIRKNYKRIKTQFFCKMFDDVYDVIESGAMPWYKDALNNVKEAA